MSSCSGTSGISPSSKSIEAHSGEECYDLSTPGDQEANVSSEDVDVEKGIEDDAEVRQRAQAQEPEGLPGGEDEAQMPRAAKAPKVPSAREIEAHELTHCPPRSWCDHCVRGQSKNFPHTTVKGELAETSVTRVSMDYCFLSEEASVTATDHEQTEAARTVMTVLIVVETLCRSIWAYACESKGASEQWVVEQVVQDLQTVGLSDERIVIKSDQEPSITELQRAIAAQRAGHGSTAVENSRVGDSNSNGRVERAIQDFKGLVRTLRSDLESKVDAKITLDHPIVPWMVRHAAHIINVSRVREDGRTAYQLMKGRKCAAKLVPFGETVLFKVPKTSARLGGFEDRWESGCWIGFVVRSGEHLVGTKDGVYKVSTVMRRAAGKRWSAEVVGAVKGTPEYPVPGSTGHHIPAYARKNQGAVSDKTVFMPAPPDAESEPRPAHIGKSDMQDHGATERCPGCKALKSGKYRAKHTVECRQRFEAILSQTEKGKRRFVAAAERRQDAITKKAMEIQEKIEADKIIPDASDQAMDLPKAAADGSGAAPSESAVEGGVAPSGDAMDDGTDGKPTAAASSSSTAEATTLRGVKRPGDEADDIERMVRDSAAQQAETKGTKRQGDEADESSRVNRAAEDMSTVDESVRRRRSHPAPRHRDGRFEPGDLEWKDIGSGVVAKTFPQMVRMVTTSRGGPTISDIHRRVITSLTTGKVIDDCVIDDVSDKELNRIMPYPDDVRIELTMKGAIKLFEIVGPDVAEIYSVPRIAQEAAVRMYGNIELRPGWSLDLTREDPLTGLAWDLGKHEVRERVRKLVRDTKPFMVVGSPPCTMFCALQNLQKGKRDEQEFQKRLENAKRHVRFCFELYAMQVQGGRFFLHEHPDTASSWSMPEVVKMASKIGTMTTVCDMCAYGMVATDALGLAPAKKGTRLMSNSPEVIKRVSRRCTNEAVNQESGKRSRVPADEAVKPKLPGGVSARRGGVNAKRHRHADLTGGRARQCQVYPRDFCRAVCEGIAAQKKLTLMGLRTEQLLSLDEMLELVPEDIKTGDPSRDLHVHEDEYETADGIVAFDDQTGASLKPALMKIARLEEMQYFRDMNVYEKVDIAECWHATGQAPIPVRWVDINKGDELSPNYRSRLVAKEYKTDIRPDLYAATPPSECLRLMMSRMASTRGAKMMYADVSRAYFYAKVSRPVYVKLPDEDVGPGDEGKCGKLVMSMYGTRDAALNWSAEYTEVLRQDGYRQGTANPCLFVHPTTDVAIMVHGDDFIAVGTDQHLAKTRATLENAYKLKVETLGPGAGCKQEIRVLNKILRYTDAGLELEADPRHAEIVVKELDLSDAKSSKVPGAKEPRRREIVKDGGREVLILDEEVYLSGGMPIDFQADGFELDAVGAQDDPPDDEDDGEEELVGTEATLYRAIAARLNYLAPDRMDIQYAVKESARAMSAPKRAHWKMLRKIGRYLLGAPRMIMKFPWQTQQSMVTSFTDSDWAGCPRTARSTSGGIVAIGDHVIKTYSRQQKVVALSSAEAELYAMVAASAESLAVISYSRDLGRELGGEIYTDSAAALGISQRAGIGKVRHLRTQGLWVQEVRVSGRLKYRKVLGTMNPSDVLTKHVPGPLLQKHIESMGMECPGGRAASAPELSSLESVLVSWTGTLRDGDKGQVSASEKAVRFSGKVQFRAIPARNAGVQCKTARKTRFPGGVHRINDDSDKLRTDKLARPRWADVSDDDSVSAVDIFHGKRSRPRARLPGIGEFGGQGLEPSDRMASN